MYHFFLRSYWAETCLSKEESTYVFHTAVTSTTPAVYGWLSESAKAETAKVALNAGESGKIMTFEEISNVWKMTQISDSSPGISSLPVRRFCCRGSK
jgi:hypothetical protein